MKNPPNSLSQILRSTPITQKLLKLTTSDDVGLNCIRPKPSIHLSAVKCVPSQLTEKVDWRKIATFHTFTKIGEKICKAIVDSESCTNIILSKLYENLGLEIIPHLTHLTCHGLTPRHLRLNNDVLSQSVSIITKIRFGVTWSPWTWVKLY